MICSRVCVVWLFVIPLFAAEPVATSDTNRSKLREFVREFVADWQGVSWFYDLPWSEIRFNRMTSLYGDWQTNLSRVDFQNLNQQGRIDYILLRNWLAHELTLIELDQTRLAEMEELVSFRHKFQQLERARWRIETIDAAAAADELGKLPDQLKKLRERLEKGKKAEDVKEEKKEDDSANKSDSDQKADEPIPLKISAVLAKRTANTVSILRGNLKTWFNYYDGFQPDFGWWMKKPYNDANTALEEFTKFLREEIAGLKGRDEDPLIGDPIGRKALEKAIAAELISYSPEELIAIGEREFAWCEEQMKIAAREMGFANDWKEALAKVKSDFVPPGTQDDFVAEQGRAAAQFVKERDLVTVPPLCEELWRVSMLLPEAQKTRPYAAYGGLSMQVAYAKDEMKHDDKMMSMRGNNRHFTRIVTAHELIPGHHLQIFVANRNNTHRSLFSTPFYVEGWALHWEMLLWDLGFGTTPEDRIGMLFWRMHRSGRIIVSLKFHLEKMTPAEMVTFLVDRVGHERFGATSEVRRYIESDYSPVFQCGYMIGALQIRALFKELVTSGRMTNKEFHDTLLAYHSIPIEMIRAGMLNLPLDKDSRTTWRFADPIVPR
ncbi:MAG: DUF885 family protein [Verrucomicrobiales bacterium]